MKSENWKKIKVQVVVGAEVAEEVVGGLAAFVLGSHIFGRPLTHYILGNKLF